MRLYQPGNYCERFVTGFGKFKIVSQPHLPHTLSNSCYDMSERTSHIFRHLQNSQQCRNLCSDEYLAS